MLKPEENNPRDRMMIRQANDLKWLKKSIADISSKTNYRIPAGYTSWDAMCRILAYALAIAVLDPFEANVDLASYFHAHRLGLWLCQNSPIYCITPELYEAIDNTDVLEKDFLKAWHPTLPNFLLFLPPNTLSSSDGARVDYLNVQLSHVDFPEWERGRWGDYKLPFLPREWKFHIQVSTCDQGECTWFTGMGVKESGEIIYSENQNCGKSAITKNDLAFLAKVRNLALNIVLMLQVKNSMVSSVEPSEAVKPGQGFTTKAEREIIRYPRWLGKNYQHKRERSNGNGGNGSSPSPHVRRGHWRSLEPGEDKPWKEAKTLFVPPTFVNF
ncbi:MAG: hypothetical protein WBB28_02115 [Crinalium sp.]